MSVTDRWGGVKDKSAVFLDRDGVINVAPEGRYVTSWKEFQFLPGVLSALHRLKRARKTVLIVSNQAGVGRGILPKKELDQITLKMLRAIRAAGGTVQRVYYCMHRPEAGCACRKPKIGMLRKAAQEHQLDLTRSFIVGDHEKEIQMGHHAGCRTVLVLSGTTGRAGARKMKNPPERIARNLNDAVRWILQQK